MKKGNLLEKTKRITILSGLALCIGSGIGFFETYSPSYKYPSIEENKKTVKPNYNRGWYALGIYTGLIAMYSGIRSEIPGIKKKEEEENSEEN